MAFHYDDGRWISDRTINGDSFNGQWLRNAEPLGLNDVSAPTATRPGGPGLVLHRPALDRLQPA